MIGHEPLIAMRRKGRVPQRVYVETRACLDRRLAREWPEVSPQSAFVLVDPEESVVRLDLRCLVGLPVEVDGLDSQRVHEVFAACVKAGASRVIGSTYRMRGECAQTFETLDSEGALTWHE
jgi:hypothetical protein